MFSGRAVIQYLFGALQTKKPENGQSFLVPTSLPARVALTWLMAILTNLSQIVQLFFLFGA
jgi:hypothetical protein